MFKIEQQTKQSMQITSFKVIWTLAQFNFAVYTVHKISWVQTIYHFKIRDNSALHTKWFRNHSMALR